MRVLVACEMSGRVRDAFRNKGHYALSCDLEPSLTPGPHYQGDVTDILSDKWDLMIAFPPCTHLASAGARWFAEKKQDGRQAAAIAFVKTLLSAPIPRIALENPRGILSTIIGKPTQIVHPYWFGDPVQKTTCLWLKGLPELEPTDMVDDHLILTRLTDWYDRTPPNGMHRSVYRSLTFPGLARAMAEQWG